MHRFHVSRRKLLESALATAAATAAARFLPGCAQSDETPSRAPRPLPAVAKTVHVAMPRAIRQSMSDPSFAARLELVVAGKRHALIAHTEQTLAATPTAAMSALDADATLSHFVEDVAFNAIGVQSYTLEYRTNGGSRVPVLGAIHIPTSRDTLRGSRKAILGDDAPQDPTTMTVTDAAVWCIFHDPGLLSFDPVTASKVVEAAKSLAEFRALKSAIRESMESASGLENGTTWIASVRDVDASGNPIPLTELDGTPLYDERGAPLYVTSWTPVLDVASAAASTVAATTSALNSDPSMLGVKYHNADGVTEASAPSALSSPRLGHEDARKLKCDDSGAAKSRRTLHVNVEGSTANVQMQNHSALQTLLRVEAVKADGTKKLVGQGVAAGVFYPGIPFPSDHPYETDVSIDCELPDDLTELRAWSIAPAIFGHCHKDLIASAHPAIDRDRYVVLAVSLLVDFALPTLMLVSGLAHVGAQKQLTGIAKQALVHLAEDAALDLFLEANNIATSGTGTTASEKIEEGGMALVAVLVKAVSRAIPEFFGVGVTALVTELYVGGAAESFIPIVGMALKIISIAQTGVQLVFAGEHLFTNASHTLYRAVVLRTLRVEVSFAPGEGQFPERAVSYEIELTPKDDESHFLPTKRVGTFNSTASSFEIEVEDFPALFFHASVKLLDRNGTQVSLGSAEFKENSGADKFVAKLTTEGVPFVVGGTSTLQHIRRLDRGPTGGRVWLGTSANPVAPSTGDDRSSDPRHGTINVLGALTFSQAKQVLAYNFSTAPDKTAFTYVAADVPRVATGAVAANRTPLRGTESRMLVHSLGDRHCLIDRTAAGQPLVVLPYVPGETQLDTLDPAALVRSGYHGNLFGRTILHARIHSQSGTLCAITDFGVEYLPLATPSVTPRQSSPLVRRGTQPGQLSAPIAIAPFRSGAQVAVLEGGANRRIQVFDLYGNPVAFTPIVTFSHLDSQLGDFDPVDLDVDSIGNYWVLGVNRTTNAPTLAVFAPQGRKVVAFYVAAARLCLNAFNETYTLNTAAYQPDAASPFEPSVSAWAPA